jgi:hypothetical protein
VSDHASARQIDLAAEVVAALRPLIEVLVDEALDRRLGGHEQSHWLTVEEYAETMRTTPAAVHKRLERGRIPGAVHEGRRWLIPIDATAATVVSHLTTRGGHRTNGPAPAPRR